MSEIEARVAEETAEQARWLPRANSRFSRPFAALVAEEFLTPEQRQIQSARQLQGILAFSARDVPYYRDMLADIPADAEPADVHQVLAGITPLTKEIIAEQGDRMRCLDLPKGEKYLGSYTSSGSTGTPSRVHQTARAEFVRQLLTQRQLRWYRFDPLADLCAIRGARVFSRVDGELLPTGQTLTLDAWPGVGKFFKTGRFLGFAYENSLEQKADWIAQQQPRYLFSTTSTIEHLAYAFQQRERPPGLEGIRVMSEPLIPSQEANIEQTLDAPVHISYGMDEIGWLATRCREGGRYHVHAESCHIEIVDANGQPCAAGDFGRILVTTLCNAAMPLIRYETDDIAQAVEGPCPCGRTLPAFGPIIGRHSLTKSLPQGTLAIVAAIREAIDGMPREQRLPLREYQLRQSADGDFQLYVIATAPRPAGFDERIHAAFASALPGREERGDPLPSLRIIEAAGIPRSPSKKFFHFVSDFSESILSKDQVSLPEESVRST